jgi:hypothetical protein
VKCSSIELKDENNAPVPAKLIPEKLQGVSTDRLLNLYLLQEDKVHRLPSRATITLQCERKEWKIDVPVVKQENGDLDGNWIHILAARKLIAAFEPF